MKSNPQSPTQKVRSLHDALWRLAGEYAFLVSETSRTSARAQVLHLFERTPLARPERITTRRVMAWELREHHRLLGAVRLRLDLGFRASFTPEEILETASRGILRVALHPALPGFPVGVVMALPADVLPRSRTELLKGCRFTRHPGYVVPFALATNPTNLGAGAALIHAVTKDCAELPSCPRVVTFSPLTGLRARVIRAVDEVLNADQLRDELRFLLRSRTCPDELPPLAGSWLLREARVYAASQDFAAGNFQRATGGELAGVKQYADRQDCDAMWTRAYFDYTNG